MIQLAAEREGVHVALSVADNGEDARRFGVPFRTPCLNRSQAKAIPEDGGVRLPGLVSREQRTPRGMED